MIDAGRVLQWIEAQHARPLWVRVIWAIGISLGSFGVRVAVLGQQPGSIFEIFLPGVLLSALMLGMQPGIVNALASGGLCLWWLTQPTGSFSVIRWTDSANVLLLVLFGIATAAITEIMLIFAMSNKD